MNTEPLIVGRWNDPHMLAGFVATFAIGAGNATNGECVGF